MTSDTVENPGKLVIFAEEGAHKKAAERLKEKLKVQIVQEMPEANSGNLVLRLDENGLALLGDGQVLQGDFTKMKKRIHPGNLNGELLVKAAKIKGIKEGLTAIDATAGLGEDAFLLAAAGFTVQLYEHDPVIAALLEDALRRAKEHPELAEIAQRMELVEGDSLVELPKQRTPVDVILLDPMFPARKKSALIKKKFQLLHHLEMPCSDEEALVHAAIENHPRKVVIKRPLKGPYLAEQKPDYSLKGKAIRYDCLVFAREK